MPAWTSPCAGFFVLNGLKNMWMVVENKKSSCTFEVLNFLRWWKPPTHSVGIFYAQKSVNMIPEDGVVAVREWFEHHCLRRLSTRKSATPSFFVACNLKRSIIMLHRKEYQTAVQNQIADQNHSVSSAVKNIYNHFGVAYPLDFILSLVESKVDQCANQDMSEVMETLRVSRIISKNLTLALEEVAKLIDLESKLRQIVAAKADFESTMEIISSIKPSEN